MTNATMLSKRNGQPAADTIGGWAAVAATIIGVGVTAFAPLWLFPPTTANGATVARYLADHRGAIQAMMLGYTLTVTLWLVFGAGVLARLRTTAPPTSMAPGAFAVGLCGFATLVLAGFTAFDIAVIHSSGAAVTKLLYDLTFGLLAMSGLPTAVALIAYASVVYRSGGGSRRGAHLAVLTATAHLLLPLSFIARTGFFSLEGLDIVLIPALLWIWIAYTGVGLLRHDHSAGDDNATRNSV